MKKKILIATMFTVSTVQAMARGYEAYKTPMTVTSNMPHTDTHDETNIIKNDRKYLFVELSGGIFRPSANILNKIYGSTWPAFQFKLTFPLFCRKIHGWMALNYASKKGNSLGGNQKTSMYLLPVSIGIRGIVPVRTKHCNLFSWYAGIAAQAAIARIWNDSNYVDRHTNGTAPGVIFETGFYIHPCKWSVISLGIDYNIARLKAQESCIPNVVSCPLRLNGLGVRLGLGYTY